MTCPAFLIDKLGMLSFFMSCSQLITLFSGMQVLQEAGLLVQSKNTSAYINAPNFFLMNGKGLYRCLGIMGFFSFTVSQVKNMRP